MTETQHRVRLPNESELRRQAQERRRDALTKLWRYVATEADDAPTDPDLTVEVLQEALDELELTSTDVAYRVSMVRQARALFTASEDERATSDTSETVLQQRRELEVQIANKRAEIDVLRSELSNLTVVGLHKSDNEHQRRQTALQLVGELRAFGMPAELVSDPGAAPRAPRVKAKVQVARVFVDNVVYECGDEIMVDANHIDGKSLVKPADYIEPTPPDFSGMMTSQDVEDMSPEQIRELEAVAAANGQVERQTELKHPLSMQMMDLDLSQGVERLREQRNSLLGAMAATGLDDRDPSVKHAKGLLDRLDAQIAALEEVPSSPDQPESPE